MPNVLKWKFKIFAKTVNGTNILHDDGTLLRYIVKLGFPTDFYLMIIHEMAKFYDIEFLGGLLGDQMFRLRDDGKIIVKRCTCGSWDESPERMGK